MTLATPETAAELVNGRYRLVRRIGSGGMGAVFEAHDRLTGAMVALKRVSPGGGGPNATPPVDGEILSLHLAREFQLLASLRHPNIISVLDYGVERSTHSDEPQLYYTMELLTDARTILEAGKDAPLAEKIRLLVQLLEALVYLHRRDILHCDLKPENVLVSADGSVRVVDFGLSSLRQHIEPGQDSVALTTAGTLTYMAPELLQGGRVSEASDLYAVGVIAYELLAGHYPFDRSTIATLIQGVLRVEADLTPIYLLDVSELTSAQPSPPTMLILTTDAAETAAPAATTLRVTVSDLATQEPPATTSAAPLATSEVPPTTQPVDMLDLKPAPPAIPPTTMQMGLFDSTQEPPAEQPPVTFLVPPAELIFITPDDAEESGQLILTSAPTLGGIVGGLLEKSPAQRGFDAREVIERLAAAGLPVQRESEDVRDSFLQAAQFVGRSRELDSLREALVRMRAGQGSAYLIGGESGIGKSRLLNELRVHALTTGVQVLWGHAVERGGAFYQMWRDPVRRLALTTPLTDFQAGVLKDIVPDIDALLGRPIPEVPPLNSLENHRRLLRTIAEIFRVQTMPTLLLVEDLHWARESLDALQTLLPLAVELPLLIIGSYRIDEADSLPDQLPEMVPIKLGRLVHREIAQLGRSMLGDNANPTLIDVLGQETEGNVLFIIEAVRTMAEEAGTLDRIGSQTLPFRTVAGGIEAVLRRRLSRVSDDARALLEVAAVAGRELDLKVMEAIWRAEPLLRAGANLDAWLTACSNAAALEIFDGQWRFTHDKLRDVLVIDVMQRGEMPALSAIVARAIETVYVDDSELGQRAGALANHWRDAENAACEAQALDRAVRVALANGLYDRALEYIARARMLLKDDPERSAMLLAQANEAHYNLGQLDRAREIGLRALSALGYALFDGASRQRQMLPFLLVYMVVAPLRRVLPVRERDENRRLNALSLFERLVMIHYFQNLRTETAYYAYLGVNLAETVSSERQLERARSYATAAIALASFQPRLSRAFSRRADQALVGVNDASVVMWASLCIGLSATIAADLPNAEQRLLRCRTLARSTGNIRRLEESLVSLAGVYYYQGRWDDTRRINDELHELAVRYNDAQSLGWALDNIGRFALRKGDFEEARATFQRGYETYVRINDQINGVWCLGAIAKAYLCENEMEAARPYVEQVLAALIETPQTSFGMIEAFNAVTEYYLVRWETYGDPDAILKAEQALNTLGRYAAIFRLAHPRYLSLAGWRQRLEGNMGAAVRLGNRSVNEAVKLGMPYDEGLACIELARHLHRTDPQREALLRRAIALFERLETAYDRGRAQRMLYNP
ncbi:MAG: protein kinase [Chloroflexi bacterium]|nr:protein kinase [Chloroflexota bacterium]